MNRRAKKEQKEQNRLEMAIATQNDFEHRFPALVSLGFHAGSTVFEICEGIAQRLPRTDNPPR